MGLGIDYVLFFYEDRNFCGKKAYLWKITDEMKATVLSKIHRVTKALEIGTPPEKDEGKCTYCMYKHECKLADAGTWKDPREHKEKPQKAAKGSKKGTAGKSTTKSKKAATGAKKASTATIKKAIQKQEAAYQAQIEHEVDMEAIDARRDW